MNQAIDLTGGLDASNEYGIRAHPKLEFLRDSVSLWLLDDAGRFGFPRITLEAAGPNWDPKLLQVNVAFPHGRVLNGSGRASAQPSEDGQDDPSLFRGGPLGFRCIEPFRRWNVAFHGAAIDTTSAAQCARTVDTGVKSTLDFDIDVSIVAPPWILGEMSKAADEMLRQREGVFIGGRRSTENGMRYEQLVRASGTLRIGEQAWSFTGSGIRVRRFGVRNLSGFSGHVWQSAVFPSGRGFGHMWLLPNHYQEGYVFDGERMLPARVVEVSWMNRMVAAGEDVSCVLETPRGRHTIQAQSVYSVFIPEGEEFPTEGVWPLHWQQAGVRYSWDGEVAYGMMERSSSPDKVAL